MSINQIANRIGCRRRKGKSLPPFDPSKIEYQALWVANGKTNADVNKDVPNLVDIANPLKPSNFAWTNRSGYQSFNQDFVGVSLRDATAGTLNKTENSFKFTSISDSEIVVNTSPTSWSHVTSPYQNKAFTIKLSSNLPNFKIDLVYRNTSSEIFKTISLTEGTTITVPELTADEFSKLYTYAPTTTLKTAMNKGDWFQVEQISEGEGLFLDGIDDSFASAKLLPPLIDYTIIGDIKFLPDNISNNNKGVSKDSIFWQGERIYINSTNIPNNLIQNVIGFSSSGTIVTKTSSIVGLVGDLKPTPGYFDSFNFPQMNFHSLAIVPYILNEAQIRATYDYIKTLKANNSKTGIAGLVASWKTYNKTNKDEDKTILKDYSGNGHHINLNNFTYTDSSGYEKGGLLFNGVDNYGICANLPIMTAESGYTIVIIRKWLNENVAQCLMSNRVTYPSSTDAYIVEIRTGDGRFTCKNFGLINEVIEEKAVITHITSKDYNNQNLSVGINKTGSNTLNLARIDDSSGYYSKIIFYSSELYNRVLSPEELNQVKTRMMKEYQQAIED